MARHAIQDDGTIKFRPTSPYRVGYDDQHVVEVTFNDDDVKMLDRVSTWTRAHEMLTPLNDMGCCFKARSRRSALGAAVECGRGTSSSRRCST